MSRRRSSFGSFLACGGIAVVAACSGGDAQLDFDPAATPTVSSPTSVAGETAPTTPASTGVTSVPSPEAAAGATGPAGSQVGAAAPWGTAARVPTSATIATTMPLRALPRTTGP